MACASIAAVLLAAGRGRRFGGNKLETIAGGTILGLHAARTMGAMGFGRLIAVHDPMHAALTYGLRALGFTLVANADPATGQSRSLNLGLAQALATQAEGVMICLADMPFITTDHLSAVVTAFDAAKAQRVVASTSNKVYMPPAILPCAVCREIAHLSGDRGARDFLSDAVLVPALPDTLADIDTASDLIRWFS